MNKPYRHIAVTAMLLFLFFHRMARGHLHRREPAGIIGRRPDRFHGLDHGAEGRHRPAARSRRGLWLRLRSRSGITANFRSRAPTASYSTTNSPPIRPRTAPFRRCPYILNFGTRSDTLRTDSIPLTVIPLCKIDTADIMGLKPQQVTGKRSLIWLWVCLALAAIAAGRIICTAH